MNVHLVHRMSILPANVQSTPTPLGVDMRTWIGRTTLLDTAGDHR